MRPFLTLSAAMVLGLAAGPVAAQASRGSAAQQQAHMLAEMGGAYEGPLQTYVANVGARVAGAAGRQGCVFTLVNSNIVNAFAAPPGCYVYVTRGLLGIINSEDELAGVLGHEVGHVTANHSGKRQTSSIFTGLGALAVGVLTGSDLAAQLASQAGQVAVLGYSRSQEFESDSLGVTYIARAGYAPRAVGDLLRALQADDALSTQAAGRQPQKAVPVWSRTHPLTTDRITRADALAAKAAPPGQPEQVDPYLAAVDGMIYGDDAAQGFVIGTRFAHPQMGVTFEAPAGFTLTNSAEAVKIAGPQGSNLAAQFSGGRLTGDLQAYAEGVLRQVAGQSQLQMGAPQRTTINGIDAVVLPALGRTSSGLVEVTVAAYAPGGQAAYHFVGLAPQGRSRGFEPMVSSFRKLTPEEAKVLKPRVIEVVTVGPADTSQSLAERMVTPDLKRERFEAINGLAPGQPVVVGQKVKLVTYGPEPKPPPKPAPTRPLRK